MYYRLHACIVSSSHQAYYNKLLYDIHNDVAQFLSKPKQSPQQAYILAGKGYYAFNNGMQAVDSDTTEKHSTATIDYHNYWLPQQMLVSRYVICFN